MLRYNFPSSALKTVVKHNCEVVDFSIIQTKTLIVVCTVSADHVRFKSNTTFNCFNRPASHRVLSLPLCRDRTKSTIVTSLLSGQLPLDNCYYISVSSFVPLQRKPWLRHVLDQSFYSLKSRFLFGASYQCKSAML